MRTAINKMFLLEITELIKIHSLLKKSLRVTKCLGLIISQEGFRQMSYKKA